MSSIIALSAVIGLIVIGSAKSLHPGWWARRAFRYGLFVFAALVPLGLVVRMLGLGRLVEGIASAPLAIAGGVMGGGGAVALLSLLFSIPFSGAMRVVASRIDLAPSPSRRRILEAAVAAVPIAMLGLTAAGVAGAFEPTKVVERRMRFPSLPSELAGLRILQITDLHLGAFHSPAMLPALVERAALAEPDLVVLTGDICDYVPWLDETLSRLASIPAKLGRFGVFGNHEYYRGARANLSAYERRGIDLLRDESRNIDVRGRRLVLVGVDDQSGFEIDDSFYERHADAALSGTASDADVFRLALCHRPKGFNALAERGAHLTLSGHTHGAQAGFGGRSVLEPIASDKYLWGRYEHAGNQLYTSSGAGHWAAFRLACPSEMPLVVLEPA